MMDSFCRTCMSQFLADMKQDIERINIFETSDFAQKLIQCTNLQIDPHDEFPSFVCGKCFTDVLAFHKFQNMCRDSFFKLSKMLEKTIKVETVDIITTPVDNVHAITTPVNTIIHAITTPVDNDINMTECDEVLPVTKIEIKCEKYELLEQNVADPMLEPMELETDIQEPSTSKKGKRSKNCSKSKEEAKNSQIKEIKDNHKRKSKAVSKVTLKTEVEEKKLNSASENEPENENGDDSFEEFVTNSSEDEEMDHLNIYQGSSGSKRSWPGTLKSRVKQMQQRLEEENEDKSSDIDDEDEKHLLEDDEVSNDEADQELFAYHKSGPELQTTNNEEVHKEMPSESPEYYKGRNGFMWNRKEYPRISRTADHNIVRLPGRPQTRSFEGYLALWLKLFDISMLECLVRFTNQKLSTYRTQFKNSTKLELLDTDVVEIKAFIGLMYYTSVLKCNDADLRVIFATDGTGHEIFRCVMSKLRFSCLLNCLRFDDSTTRQERLKEDPLAPISNVFHKFISNSQSQYIPGPYLCIDEMLLPFRGRCRFIIYMPQKLAKYGIKIMLLVDAHTYYIYNAYIYYGENSDGIGMTEEERKMSVPSQSVLRLVKVIENSNRNITANNCFSSILLVEMLLKKGLTFLGTLTKSKAEIPSCFLPSKHREVESSLYGFTKDYTLLSYVPRKNKAVLLISSSHHNQEVDAKTKKPKIIVDYSHTKGAVDEIDKICSIYSCCRKTRSWPMAVFQRMLDMIGLNSFVLYQMCADSDKKMKRKTYILNMARELVLDHLKARVYNERLPRELRIMITGVLGKDLPPPPPPTIRSIPSSGRKLCSICPSKIKRVTRYCCCNCLKSICLQCSKPLCEICQNNGSLIFFKAD